MAKSGCYFLNKESTTSKTDISKGQLIKLGESTVALQVTTKINQQNSLNLICKIYASINSNSLDLPVGLKAIIMERAENMLGEQTVTKQTGIG